MLYENTVAPATLGLDRAYIPYIVAMKLALKLIAENKAKHTRG